MEGALEWSLNIENALLVRSARQNYPASVFHLVCRY